MDGSFATARTWNRNPFRYDALRIQSGLEYQRQSPVCTGGYVARLLFALMLGTSVANTVGESRHRA